MTAGEGIGKNDVVVRRGLSNNAFGSLLVLRDVPRPRDGRSFRKLCVATLGFVVAVVELGSFSSGLSFCAHSCHNAGTPTRPREFSYRKKKALYHSGDNQGPTLLTQICSRTEESK